MYEIKRLHQNIKNIIYIYIYIYNISLLYNINVTIIYNCLCGSVAKASYTQAVGHVFDPRPDH